MEMDVAGDTPSPLHENETPEEMEARLAKEQIDVIAGMKLFSALTENEYHTVRWVL